MRNRYPYVSADQNVPAVLLNSLAQRFGTGMFSPAEWFAGARHPAEFSRLQRQLQAAIRLGFIRREGRSYQLTAKTRVDSSDVPDR
ncbi:hypothetical protein BWP39_09900 [Paraburkholderia acidicola]|uniref:DUF2087 domain-containing protein n=1 Tax=Paraburkholderia acidicola TaxID=1912599 RepID=A0A2A4F406_9BURK|nr:hypothetical protein [Paraburkholderia acidicola]PCE27089.1 hypothetical protein BWP39_09900 [Paraburkholderia acidicola]